MREGWEYKKLEDCAEIEYGTRVVQKRDGGTIYPVYGGGGETFKMDTFNREDCLIVARFAMSKCCVRYVSGKFFLNDSGLSVKAGGELYQDYLNHNIMFLNDDIYNLGKGAAQRNLDVKAFKLLKIAIPPKSVQLEIVSELDQINELIRLKKEQLKDYDKLAQSIFYEMFGDPVENESRESKNYKLIELCENKDDIKCGPFGTQLSKSEYVQSGVPVWGIPQINSHFQEPPTCFVSNLKADSLKDYSVKWGDIVMSRKGSVGLCCVFPKNMSSGILHSDVIRLRFDEKMVDSIFMMHYLHFSSFIRHQIKTISHGAIMAGLNVTKLKSLKVILPPLPLQQEFSSCISQIERQKAEVSNAIADLETLLASRMQYWFE